MSLPDNVIEKDKRLARSADQLMELRWHWTLDKSNPDRVSLTDYAKSVEVSRARVGHDANGWADYLAAGGRNLKVARAGQPSTPADFRELAKMGAERQQAAKAVARTTGKAIGTVAQTRRREIDSVLTTARERANRRGTKVEAEIEVVADNRERARSLAASDKADRKAKATAQFIKVEGDIGYAIRRLRNALEDSDVEFSAEERELLSSSLNKLRALLTLLDLRITGQTADIDWDAELSKIAD